MLLELYHLVTTEIVDFSIWRRLIVRKNEECFVYIGFIALVGSNPFESLLQNGRAGYLVVAEASRR
jgi:hypothetical protein